MLGALGYAAISKYQHMPPRAVSRGDDTAFDRWSTLGESCRCSGAMVWEKEKSVVRVALGATRSCRNEELIVEELE